MVKQTFFLRYFYFSLTQRWTRDFKIIFTFDPLCPVRCHKKLYFQMLHKINMLKYDILRKTRYTHFFPPKIKYKFLAKFCAFTLLDRKYKQRFFSFVNKRCVMVMVLHMQITLLVHFIPRIKGSDTTDWGKTKHLYCNTQPTLTRCQRRECIRWLRWHRVSVVNLVQ